MKKLGLLVLVLVVVVASLGVGYAIWSEQLTINSSVTTGDLDVIFDGTAAVDVVDTHGVAIGTITPNGKTATLTITNAYPGATCSIPVDLLNQGSIPAETGPYYWMDPAGNDEYFTITNPTDMPITLPVSTTTVPADFSITINDWDELKLDGTHTIHALQEDTAYTVTIKLDIYQSVP